MHRVTSRQRLFSWDQFDATTDSPSTSDDESDYVTCLNSVSRNTSFALEYDDDYHQNNTSFDEYVQSIDKKLSNDTPNELSTPHDMMVPLNDTPFRGPTENDSSFKRTNAKSPTSIKKSVSFSNLIAKDYYQDSTTAKDTPFTLSKLNCDVQLDIISFLTAEEVQCVGMTCRYFNDMLLVVKSSLSPEDQSSSVARNTIWWPFLREMWPHLPLLSREEKSSIDPPTKIVFANSSSSNKTINFGALLKQTPIEAPPSFIDEKFYTDPFLAPPATAAPTTPTQPTPPTPPPATDTPPMTDLSANFRSGAEVIAAARKRAFTTYEMKACIAQKSHHHPDEIGQQSTSQEEGQAQKLDKAIRVIQFTGVVGTGDRCVKSDRPFPRPLESIEAFESLRLKYYDDEASASRSYDTSNQCAIDLTCSFIQRRTNRRRKRKERKSQSPLFPPETNLVPSPTRAFFEMLKRGRECHARFVNNALVADSSTRTGSAPGAVVEKPRTIPFVSPFVVSDPSIDRVDQHGCYKFATIDMTPRMVAYFEVSILTRDTEQEPKVLRIGQPSTDEAVNFPQRNNAILTNRQPQLPRQRQHAADCVAIGLSMKSSQSRMPGWDRLSYGYHGDDGGIFHSRGDMVRVYGPKYGEGDTVGCGVNYENGGIFFTLNGSFLGYAWCGLGVIQEGKTGLYPTVGVDSHCPLGLNFGNERPFMFDLSKFVESKGTVPTPNA